MRHSQPMETFLNVRVSRAELMTLKDAAKERGTSVSSLVRESALRSAALDKLAKLDAELLDHPFTPRPFLPKP